MSHIRALDRWVVGATVPHLELGGLSFLQDRALGQVPGEEHDSQRLSVLCTELEWGAEGYVSSSAFFPKSPNFS
jgi:hypothetical protein